MELLSQFKIFIRDIMYVSKLTGTKNKKGRVLLSVILLFASFGSDLIIIVTIASLFQDDISNNNFVVNFFVDNLFLLPAVVVSRFLFSYLDILNSYKLKFQIEENLRVYLLEEVFDKTNYSMGDAFHFLNSFLYFFLLIYLALFAFVIFLLEIKEENH